MDIIIRNIDPVILKKIDEVAKRNKQSRQVYLQKQIELMATDYMQSEKVSYLEKQLQANTIILKEVADAMNNMTSIIEEMSSGSD